MCNQIMSAIGSDVFTLITNLNAAECGRIRYHGTQEFVMIASHVYNPSATFSVTQNSTDNVGVALFPSQFVLLNFPSIDNVSYKIQSIAGVVLEEVV